LLIKASANDSKLGNSSA